VTPARGFPGNFLHPLGVRWRSRAIIDEKKKRKAEKRKAPFAAKRAKGTRRTIRAVDSVREGREKGKGNGVRENHGRVHRYSVPASVMGALG